MAERRVDDDRTDQRACRHVVGQHEREQAKRSPPARLRPGTEEDQGFLRVRSRESTGCGQLSPGAYELR